MPKPELLPTSRTGTRKAGTRLPTGEPVVPLSLPPSPQHNSKTTQIKKKKASLPTQGIQFPHHSLLFPRWISQAGSTYLPTSRWPSSPTWATIRKQGCSKPLLQLRRSRHSNTAAPGAHTDGELQYWPYRQRYHPRVLRPRTEAAQAIEKSQSREASRAPSLH